MSRYRTAVRVFNAAVYSSILVWARQSSASSRVTDAQDQQKGTASVQARGAGPRTLGGACGERRAGRKHSRARQQQAGSSAHPALCTVCRSVWARAHAWVSTCAHIALRRGPARQGGTCAAHLWWLLLSSPWPVLYTCRPAVGAQAAAWVSAGAPPLRACLQGDAEPAL